MEEKKTIFKTYRVCHGDDSLSVGTNSEKNWNGKSKINTGSNQ